MRFEIFPIMADAGTHKDSGRAEVVENALQQNANTISVISNGNYVRAIAQEIGQHKGKRLTLVNLVNRPLNLDFQCKEIIVEGKRILRNSAEREAYVRGKMPDSGKVKDYTDFFPKHYGNMAMLILWLNADPHREQYAYFPDYISVPVGSGKLFLALTEQIKKDKLSTKVIGIVPEGENGIFNDSNLSKRCGRLYYKKFSPQSIADKLACPYTSFKPLILEAIRDGHMIYEADNDEFSRARQFGNSIGCDSEPSATAGFVIYGKYARERLELSEKALTTIVYTGFGSGNKWNRTFKN